jgi:xanthine dehydrogenase molybdopterin-binding subunit B
MTGIQAQSYLTDLVDELMAIPDPIIVDGSATAVVAAAEHAARMAAAQAIISWARMRALVEVVAAAERQGDN